MVLVREDESSKKDDSLQSEARIKLFREIFRKAFILENVS